jgi:hypothetical protein
VLFPPASTATLTNVFSSKTYFHKIQKARVTLKLDVTTGSLV